jgi:predicted aspartyl protease
MPQWSLPTTSQFTEVPLEEYDGIPLVRVTINGGASFGCELDTGAESFVIPYNIFVHLVEEGDLTIADGFQRVTGVELAGGSKDKAVVIDIRDVGLGNLHIRNVETVVMTGGICLLGREILYRFGTFTIDRQRGVLRFARG